jgi:hypothetical protein
MTSIQFRKHLQGGDMGAAQSLTFLPLFVTISSGLLGALIGGGAILIAARKAADAAAHRARSELMRQHGEELVSLLCEAEYWHRGLGDAVANLERPLIWPPEPYRVRALVEAYFRGLSQEAIQIEAACRKYRVFLLKARQDYIEGIEEANPELETLHMAISIAAHALREKVLTAMQESS